MRHFLHRAFVIIAGLLVIICYLGVAFCLFTGLIACLLGAFRYALILFLLGACYMAMGRAIAWGSAQLLEWVIEMEKPLP